MEQKRQLPTTVSPEGVVQKRAKVPVAAIIFLVLTSDDQDTNNELCEEDFDFNLMNIENIPPEGNRSSEVRVFISYIKHQYCNREEGFRS